MAISEASAAFWRDRGRWPFEPKGYVFLGNALHEVAKAKLGDKWRGNEPGTTRDLHGIDEDHKTVRLFRLGQFFKVIRAMRAALEAGDLECVCRPHWGDGKMEPVKRAWWNHEASSERFQFCTLDLLNPTKPATYDEATKPSMRSFLYVTRDSLDAYLASLGAGRVPQTDGDQPLSPYLWLMIAVARRLSITPENQPPKAEVVAALRDEASDWKRNPPISKAMFEAMATLIREPEGQLGKANKAASPDSEA